MSTKTVNENEYENESLLSPTVQHNMWNSVA